MKEETLINEFAFDIRKALSDSLHIKRDGLNDNDNEINIINQVNHLIKDAPIEPKIKDFAEKIRSIPYYEALTRIGVTIIMLIVFSFLNWYVIDNINKAVVFDMDSIKSKLYGPEHRLITEKVYMSLITGVVVQASAVFFTIIKFLFRDNSNKKEQESISN